MTRLDRLAQLILGVAMIGAGVALSLFVLAFVVLTAKLAWTVVVRVWGLW